MGVRVTKRHNKDGSITKRTTYTRKTLLGNRKSETFVEHIPAKSGCLGGCLGCCIPILSAIALIIFTIGMLISALL